MSMEMLDQLRRGELVGAQRVAIAANLSEFPREIFDLAESLEILDLSYNQLTTLPADLGRLQRLRILFCYENAFEVLPEVLGDCPNLSMVGFKANRIHTVPAAALPPLLRWLILTDNAIAQLPAILGQRQHLQKLMLAGNQLTTLPEEMAACHNLELIRLAANCFEQIPRWLFDLPRLAWLAFSGNPCTATPRCLQSDSRPDSLPAIHWSDLQVGELLGEGASGRILKGHWVSANKAVAIKVFKGAVTSDGLPSDEMRACMAAGMHPHLVGVLGRVGEPGVGTGGVSTGGPGLVLPLVSPEYRILGQTPSLESCTRDVYGPEQRFAFSMVLGIARGIASAAAHLHGRGILHGDLYAHNTLVNPVGHCLLGDFGAATQYDRGDVSLAAALERLEVRAFGCLLEELLERCELEGPELEGLRRLERDCLGWVPAERPGFAEIVERLG